MNTRLEDLKMEYKPTLALVVHKSTVEYGTDKYYLESHDIDENGKVLAGKPLMQETLEAIVGTFFDEGKGMIKLGGVIPENLLSYNILPGGQYSMTWYRPEEIRVIHHAKQLKLPTAKTWVPATLYHVNRRELRVFALKDNKRPKAETKLYHAPYFNVWDSGQVCLGNANVKKPTDKTYQAFMKYWEDLFWLSEFTHVNGEENVRSKNMASVWQELLTSKTKIKWSDINELLPSKKLLKSLL